MQEAGRAPRASHHVDHHVQDKNPARSLGSRKPGVDSVTVRGNFISDFIFHKQPHCLGSGEESSDNKEGQGLAMHVTASASGQSLLWGLVKITRAWD